MMEAADPSLNRIGNLLVPNSNYCKFEDWVVPILDQMVKEQDGEDKTVWSPSKVIARLGKEIDNEESVYYWCYKVSHAWSISLYGLVDRGSKDTPTRRDVLVILRTALIKEQHPRLLSRSHGRFVRRYDLLPHVQDGNAVRARHCLRHTAVERYVSQGEESGHDHPRRRCVQAPNRQCDALREFPAGA